MNMIFTFPQRIQRTGNRSKHRCVPATRGIWKLLNGSSGRLGGYFLGSGCQCGQWERVYCPIREAIVDQVRLARPGRQEPMPESDG